MPTQMPVAHAPAERVPGESLRFGRILSLKFLKRIHSDSLHYHAAHGNKQEVLRLLEQGSPPNVPGYRGKMPLMLACGNRHAECATLLLTYGSNVLLCTGDHSRTCLHYAAKGGDPACLRTVLRFAKEHPMDTPWGFSNFVNWRDNLGVTALHYAARSRKVENVRMLLRAGAYLSLNNGQNRTSPVGSFPLHWAAAAGDVAVVKELLLWGADRSHRDFNCQTAFMVAMKSGNAECAAVLNPRAKEPISWPTPWEHILPAQGSQARKWMETALATALSPAAAATAGDAAGSSRGSKTGKGQQGAEGGQRESGQRRFGRLASRGRSVSVVVARGGQEVEVIARSATEGAVQSGGSALTSSSDASMGASQLMSTLSSARRSRDGDAAAARPAQRASGEHASGEHGIYEVFLRASKHLLSAMCIAPDASMPTRSLSQVAPDKGDEGGCEEEVGEGSKASSGRLSELEVGVYCDICCSPKDDMLAIVPCEHQICSLCFLSLCCHSKPSKQFPHPTSPACPFCRAKITAVTVAPPSS